MARRVAVAAGCEHELVGSHVQPGAGGVVLEYANRGVRLQVLLRAGLVVFIALTLVLVPPEEGAVAGYAIVGAYAIWAAWFAAWAWRGGLASPAGRGSGCSPTCRCWPA